MKIDKLFSGLKISSLGLSAQRKRMNAIANNIANAETTRTENGTPYRRKVVSVQQASSETFVEMFNKETAVRIESTSASHFSPAGAPFTESDELPGSVEAAEQEDMSDFKLVHDPTHPDADENGYVKMPNVNMVTEMVDMMSASRAYEANITAINAQKQMAKDSLEI
ncbi:MAG: flagellar basal body rod protein FlgC [Ignavibacteriae bacterium]|nr:flagellar basal body rod protein FlgC [Ignavibacteriota bacterium]